MPALSKRRYESAQELSRDYWDNHYKQSSIYELPSNRLMARLLKDGAESIAWKLWHNYWHLLNTNSGLHWNPTHKTINRKLFGTN